MKKVRIISQRQSDRSIDQYTLCPPKRRACPYRSFLFLRPLLTHSSRFYDLSRPFTSSRFCTTRNDTYITIGPIMRALLIPTAVSFLAAFASLHLLLLAPHAASASPIALDARGAPGEEPYFPSNIPSCVACQPKWDSISSCAAAAPAFRNVSEVCILCTRSDSVDSSTHENMASVI